SLLVNHKRIAIIELLNALVFRFYVDALYIILIAPFSPIKPIILVEIKAENIKQLHALLVVVENVALFQRPDRFR
ncbi:MAG: hypothetical protein OEX02_08635, partial [Cyclobacteriaceae bacterium]|nr:hypothetical protein [Cyclobacteriaceae bacterium]